MPVSSRSIGNYSQKLDIHDIVFIPVSALKGDNVVEKSENMPWYDGATLLHCLENIHVSADRNLVDFRFPVQYVIRPHQDFRGFAGKIVSGTITPGEEIVVLPSGNTAAIKSITTYDGDLPEAFAPQSVVLTLDEEIDVSRGDMIVRKKNLPQVETRLEAIICWMDETAFVHDDGLHHETHDKARPGPYHKDRLQNRRRYAAPDAGRYLFIKRNRPGGNQHRRPHLF